MRNFTLAVASEKKMVSGNAFSPGEIWFFPFAMRALFWGGMFLCDRDKKNKRKQKKKKKKKKKKTKKKKLNKEWKKEKRNKSQNKEKSEANKRRIKTY